MQNRNEITPKTIRTSKEYMSGEKPPLARRSYRNKSFQSLNYTFIDDPAKKQKNYIGPITNIEKSCKHTLIKEILSYASTAPRPFLNSEADKPLIYELSSKGSEFNILSSYLSQTSLNLVRATKSYTHSLIISLPKNENSLGFLSNCLNHNKIRILFMQEGFSFLQDIFFNSALSSIDKNILLTSQLKKSDNSQKIALICLAIRDKISKIEEGIYSILDSAGIVPIYLLTFSYN